MTARRNVTRLPIAVFEKNLPKNRIAVGDQVIAFPLGFRVCGIPRRSRVYGRFPTALAVRRFPFAHPAFACTFPLRGRENLLTTGTDQTLRTCLAVSFERLRDWLGPTSLALFRLIAEPSLNGPKRSPLGRFAAGLNTRRLAGSLDVRSSLLGQAAIVSASAERCGGLAASYRSPRFVWGRFAAPSSGTSERHERLHVG